MAKLADEIRDFFFFQINSNCFVYFKFVFLTEEYSFLNRLRSQGFYEPKRFHNGRYFLLHSSDNIFQYLFQKLVKFHIDFNFTFTVTSMMSATISVISIFSTILAFQIDIDFESALIVVTMMIMMMMRGGSRSCFRNRSGSSECGHNQANNQTNMQLEFKRKQWKLIIQLLQTGSCCTE